MTQGSGLSDAYTATITRLKAQKGHKSTLGLKVLMWVLYSERPLKAEELCHALGVELGSRDLDLENIPALRTLLASSLGLVTVEVSSSTVRLVHFTLQEHLLSDSTLFHSPHSTIAEVCLTYLNYQCVRDLSPTLRSPPAAMPLLEYASYYWGEHTRGEVTENVKILALRLLDKFDEHISAQLISLAQYTLEKYRFTPQFNCQGGPIGFTGLHGAAFLGIVAIFSAVLEMKEWDVNAKDNASCTPLMWAAIRGHGGVVKMLLGRGDVNPDLAGSRWNWSPLMWAIAKKDEGVVKVFLERRGLNSDQASSVYDQAVLLHAAAYGHEGVVKMILEREDISPNQVPGESHTPLALAAVWGHEEVVKMCLERKDINPNIAGTDKGYTPLAAAAAKGHEGIVKMLLDRKDIRIDIQDHKNQTALSLALSEGHDEIARMISERATIMSDIADPGSEESLPSSAGDEDEFMAETEPSDDYSNTNTANLSGEPTSPPGDPDALEELLDWEGLVPDSADSIVPSTGRPVPLSSFPVTSKVPVFSKSAVSHLDNVPSTLPITVNRQLMIASFICILAILIYVLPFSFPGIFSLP